MKYSFLLLTFFIFTFSHTANSLIAHQPTPSDKTKETITAMIGMHCIDAYTDPLPQYCPRITRWCYHGCKTFICLNMAYDLSNEITTTCGVGDDSLIRNALIAGIDVGLLQFIQGAQARFGIKRKKY